MVEYSNRVVPPLSAILTKLPKEKQEYTEAISLYAQTLDGRPRGNDFVNSITNTQFDESQRLSTSEAYYPLVTLF